MTRTLLKKKICKKTKWVFDEALRIAEESRKAKDKGKMKRYTQLNAEFHKIAKIEKKPFLKEQCKEI